MDFCLEEKLLDFSYSKYSLVDITVAKSSFVFVNKIENKRIKCISS